MRAIATGTEFAMRHFREDTVTVLHVKEGTVELRVGDDVRQVTKGMSFSMTNSGALRVPSTDELSEATSWTDGTLVISGRPLSYVLPQMKRWYGTGINVADKSLLSRPVFVSAPLNSPREAIASIEKSGQLKFTYIGENMAFEDAAKKGGATKAAGATTTKTKK
jgi:ferric-dicitrate binding protein FerR (iron transport regulator)